MAGLFAFFRSRKRRKLAREPMPQGWQAIIKAKLPFAAKLEDEARARFETQLKVFVWEKHWVGVRGLRVTDEMKVVIAGQAARIARNLSLDCYDRLTEVVLYPSHYVHPERDGMIIYGEAHRWGTVVLSWDAVKHGLVNPRDGHDTTIHELAHVLDVSDGAFDGTPPLHARADYGPWAQVLTAHYLQLRSAPERGVLRAYGAINEAELFAVATEAFFERPRTLRREAPDLYEVLQRYYQLDPAPRA